MSSRPRYYALRVHDRAESSEWWASARAATTLPPPAIWAILAGRGRVELTADEALAAISWASALAGWDAGERAPLRVYPSPPPCVASAGR
jgi:hypothetical protein